VQAEDILPFGNFSDFYFGILMQEEFKAGRMQDITADWQFLRG
jgi:hypothetical protein